MSKKIKVDREILIFAFRYALGRMSYAPISVINNISSNIQEISTEDIELYIKEIKEYENYRYDMECDKHTWLNFKNFLEKELEKRISLGI